MEVLKAINAVSAEISKIGIAKDRRAQADGSYQYRGIDDYLNALSPLLAKHQLVIVPKYRDCKSTEVAKTAKGNPILQASVTGDFTLYGMDGTSVAATVTGEARDSSDKAVNKAMSVCYKYMAAQVFCIPFVGMEDSEATVEPEGDPVPAFTDNDRQDWATKIGAATTLDELKATYETLTAMVGHDQSAAAYVVEQVKIRKAALKRAA